MDFYDYSTSLNLLFFFDGLLISSDSVNQMKTEEWHK